MLYRLPRPGSVDLEFEGQLLADESTQGESRGARQVDHSRWSEVRIYRLDSGDGWVTEMVGKSSRRGEVDRPRVTVCRTPEEVRESLQRKPGTPGKGYIINAAFDAMAEAAEKDPRLLPITVERL